MPKNNQSTKKRKPSKTEPLFERPDVLFESSYNELTVRQEKDYDYIAERIKYDIESKESKIIAFLGPNGSGKSTVLRRSLEKSLEDIRIKPIVYEIWQYQDEGKLWENALISILSSTNKPSSKNKIAKKIKNGSIRKWLLAIQLVICAVAFFLSFKYFVITIDGNKQYLNIGSLFLSIFSFGIIGFSLSRLHTTGSIDYIYQYENELLKRLKKRGGKPIVLLVEDVDRTENGERIVESLHAFINTNRPLIKNSLIVICPMSRESFYGNRDKSKATTRERMELSNKIYDYAINGHLVGTVTENDIDTILSQSKCTSQKIKPVIMGALKITDKQFSLLNLRALKFVLRDVDQFIRRYPNLDEGIATLFAIEKYITINISTALFEDNAIRQALINPKGTAINNCNINADFSSLFGEAFGVKAQLKSMKTPGSNIYPPIILHYQKDDKPHRIIESVNSRSINISISGHYKELL